LNAGHLVIDWKPSKHAEILTCLRNIWQAGAQEDFQVVTSPSGEPVISSMDPEDNTPVTDILDARATKATVSAYQLWQIQKQKRNLREEYLQLWEDTVKTTGTGRAVDAIIAPVAANTAIAHGKNRSASYTSVWNMLDYSSLVIPVSKVDPELDLVKAPHKFYNEDDKANYERYNPVDFMNAPISIQLVGRTLEEEAVIAMGEIVDAALKSHH